MEGIRLGEAIAYLQITERRNRRTNKGGRPSKNGRRNALMCDEFLRRQRAGSKLKPTALKEKIGADCKFMMSIGSKPLAKSASIAAIDTALETIR